jgi:hypothetical protein
MIKPVLVAGALTFCICQALTAQSNARYYIIAGSYTTEKLAQMVQSGLVKSDTRVWTKDMEVWVAAKTIAELQTLFPPEIAPQDNVSLPPLSPSVLPQRADRPKIAMGYYALLNGPFNVDTLLQMVQSGELVKNNLVWTQGMEQWVPAGTVAELQPLFKDEIPAKKFHFGLGVGVTGYSREGVAPGATVSASFSFIPALLAGITAGCFSNIEGLSTVEAGGFLRGNINLKKITLFAQGEGGIALFFEDAEMKNSYFAGGKLGVIQSKG